MDKSTSNIVERIISARLEKYMETPPARVWDLIEEKLDKLSPKPNGKNNPAHNNVSH